MAFDGCKVVGDDECKIEDDSCFAKLAPQLFLMEIVANGGVDHTHGLTSKRKDVIDNYLS